jgi:stage V sporulation protein R
MLDAALALEPHVDVNQELHRSLYPKYTEHREAPLRDDPFAGRFKNLPGEKDVPEQSRERRNAPLPPHPESDLLWFIANYGPEMEDWERDIFLAVRHESFYFYPVFACNIMNEGLGDVLAREAPA